MEPALDFFEDRVPEETNLAEDPEKKLGKLSELVTTMINYENQINLIETRLAGLKQEYDRVRLEEIPTMMAELGLLKLVSLEGHTLELKDVINASLPKDEPRRSNALKWLRDQGHGDLIKNEVSVLFGRGEDEKAENLIHDLEHQGLEPTRNITVNFQSLSALIRGLRRDGLPVDEENLTLYEAKVAKIKRKKEVI